MTLGQIAHQEVLKIFHKKISDYKFAHGNSYSLTNKITVYSSYHCSKYNTLTKRLTEKMFHNIIKEIKTKINKKGIIK